MSNELVKRSAQEIEVRCDPILNNKEIISLVKDSSSPTAAFEMVFAKTGNSKLAKGARWLAILRREYPDNYKKVIDKTNTRHENEKGENR